MKTFFSIVLVLVLTIALAATLILGSARSSIGSREFVKNEMLNEQTVSHLTTILGQRLDVYLEENGKQDLPQQLVDRFPEVKAELLDVPWLTQQLHTLTDGLFDWLEGTTTTPVLVVDLREKKQALGTLLSDIQQEELAAIPLCTEEMLRSGAPCRQASMSLEELERMTVQPGQISEALANIPESLDLLSLPKTLENTPVLEPPEKPPLENLEPIRSIFTQSRGWLNILIAFDTLLVLLLALLHLRSVRGIMRWVGLGLLIPGSLVFLFMVFADGTAGMFLEQNVARTIKGIPQETAVALVQNLTGITRGILGQARFISALIGAIGFLLVAASFYQQRVSKGPTIIRH